MKTFILSNREIKDNIINFSIKFGHLNLYTNYKPRLKKNSKSEIFFFGSIYGKISNNKILKINENNVLHNLLRVKNPQEYINNLDGRFIIFIKKKNKIDIITDKFSRHDIFFHQKNYNFIISNNFKIICRNSYIKTIDQVAVSHMINVLGTKPAKKETIFNEIKRLGVGETLELSKKLSLNKKKFNPKLTEDYNYKKIKEYYDIFFNYLQNLGKNKKMIFMSSGFDSSFLASMATKVYGNKNVSGIIVKQKFSERSKLYNKFEIDRVKKIGKYLGIKIFYGEINLVKNFQKYAESLSEIGSNRMVPMTLAAIMHYELSKKSKKYSIDNQLLSGEVSDGVHNFGFAQYANFFKHESNGLREYVDKMMNYLYSPSFFSKILNGSHLDDYVFKFLLDLKKIDIKNLKKINSVEKAKNAILTSLFLTDKRFPLLKDQSQILNKNKVESIEKYYQNNYFSNIKFSDKNQLYSSYIYLYNSFHWQAGTVSTMYELPDHYNLQMVMPYWNPILHNYLEIMPENWGRGLETKTLKYPLKENLSKNFDIMNVLNLGPHSYQYDVNRYSDPFLEILISKSTKKYVNEIFKKYHPCEYLSSIYFNHNLINQIIKGYKKGELDTSKASLTYRLFTLSKLLKDLNY